MNEVVLAQQPSKRGPNRHIQLRVPAELHRQLRLRAVLEDRTSAEIVRDAVARYRAPHAS